MKRLPFKKSWRSIAIATVLASAAAIVAGSAWLSLEFMKDPRSVVWLNRYLPDNAKIPINGWDDPKTMAEIQTDLRKSGLVAGDPILINMTLKSDQPINDLLLPIFRPIANSDDLSLVEVRVYRTVFDVTARKKEAFQFINQLAVRELEESFAIDPLVQAKTTNSGSDRRLPLTSVQRYDNAPNNGIWISAVGHLQRGDAQIAYGQLIYYNPASTSIRAVLPWTSTTDELPAWQSVAKGRPPELVVNHTVGLEPDLQTYQLRTVEQGRSVSVKLQPPISLTKPAIGNGTFGEALFLARNGLWSTALEMMKSVRQNYASNWTIAAQAQMDLVDRHAKITQSQAEQSSAAPTQQILANLIDGRWTRATQLLQPSDAFEVLALLKTDAGRIQKRINAALSLNNARSDVQTWAALMRTAKQGRPSAIAWLIKQPQDSARIRAQTLQFLNQLDATALSTQPSPKAHSN